MPVAPLPASYSKSVQAVDHAKNPLAAMRAGNAWAQEYSKLSDQQRQQAVTTENVPKSGWASFLNAFNPFVNIMEQDYLVRELKIEDAAHRKTK